MTLPQDVEKHSSVEKAAVEALLQTVHKFLPPESVGKALEFKPRPDDVIICTPFKCGTTWMQQIVQTLRSGGDLSFREINEVIPYMETQGACGLGPLDQEPKDGFRRCFKSHFSEQDCPKGCKVIYVCRNPLEVVPSHYLYWRGWLFDEDAISLAAFTNDFMIAHGEADFPRGGAPVWQNIASWYLRRADPNVLWITYEDMLQDLPAAVRLVAEFTGLGAGDAQLQALACQQASLAAMKANVSKYNEGQPERNAALGRPPNAGNAKVRCGQGRTREVLTPELAAAIQAKWGEACQPVTGYASFAEMRAGVNRELGRPFSSS